MGWMMTDDGYTAGRALPLLRDWLALAGEKWIAAGYCY